MVLFKGCGDMELLDWLFDQKDGILRNEETQHHDNHHTWTVQETNVRLKKRMFSFPLIV